MMRFQASSRRRWAVLASVASIDGLGVRTNRPREQKRAATGQNAPAKDATAASAEVAACM